MKVSSFAIKRARKFLLGEWRPLRDQHPPWFGWVLLENLKTFQHREDTEEHRGKSKPPIPVKR